VGSVLLGTGRAHHRGFCIIRLLLHYGSVCEGSSADQLRAQYDLRGGFCPDQEPSRSDARLRRAGMRVEMADTDISST
jgi:hypothetical protein